MEQKTRKIVLTEREKRILEMVSNGFTNLEISQKLNVKPPTISTVILNALRKTGCINRSHLVRWGFENEVLKKEG